MFFALVFSTFVLGFFDVRRFCEDAEETSIKMPSRPTAAIEVGARGLVERVKKVLRIVHIFRAPATAHQLPQGVPSAGRQPPQRLVPCVHDVHGPNGLNHSRSASPSSPAYVAAVGHEGIFSEASSSSSPKRIEAKYLNVPEIKENTKKVARTESGTFTMKI